MFVNDQHSTVTLYCDKVARCRGSYLEFKFITFHYQLLFGYQCKKTLTDFSAHFKDVIQNYYCQLSPVFA